jgi:hypothetical protein
MKKYLAYSVSLVFLVSVGVVFAEIKTLIKEYTYQASKHKIEPSPIFHFEESCVGYYTDLYKPPLEKYEFIDNNYMLKL